MHASQRMKLLFICGSLIILVTLACSVFTNVSNESVSPGTDEQGEFANPPIRINTPVPAVLTASIDTLNPTHTAFPTDTIVPSDTPEPSVTPTLSPTGVGRINPYPSSEIASLTNWDVQVLEVKRGDEAWRDVQDANMFNEAAPAGMEYVLVKLHVKSKYTDSEEHSISDCDFAVTGDRLILYTCSMASVVEPEPQLDARLYTGGESEGWAGYLVGQGEGNLMIVFDELFTLDDEDRYIALDEGASISVLPELADIIPNDPGRERINPASRSEKIITEDWEVSVLEVVRGDEAWNMVQDVNQYNDPPPEGMEYIAVKLHVRYIGTEDEAMSIDGYSFKTTGSANVLYDTPSVVDPEPGLDISLYPGGEYEGWAVVQAAIGETGVMLVFEPLFDFGGQNTRFILLEP